jgi:8-oxo-dGTP pyrophosphatase MutT (NUDIX family)
MPVPRVGGRLLLVDPDDRVLLIEERLGDGATQWLTPGGGVEPGETPAKAAVREVYEETGIRTSLPPETSELLRVRREWSWDGVTYDQVDHYFVVRVPAGLTVRPVALTPMERLTVVGWRWWTLAELHASTETFVLPDTADLLAQACATPRLAGRVLLLDADDRVLLIENLVDVDASSTHWITPGGGADPGETPAQAAVRELDEELGVRITLPRDAAAVYTDREVFTFNSHYYDQTNHYYVVRLEPGTALTARGVDAVERSVLVGERWWSLAELRSTAAVVYPVGLAELLAGLLSSERAGSA